MKRATEQESFWEGTFGDDYCDRNRGANCVASNAAFFARALGRTSEVHDVLELGSNIGLNLMALRILLPSAGLSAVEINKKAAAELRSNVPDVDLHLTSLLDFQPERTWDLVFTKGVLIHIDPANVARAYDLMYQASSRYILTCEYYNPVPQKISYRGHEDKLFKRDFAGDILDRFPDVDLLDYGFVYRRDALFPQDDISWFLMEKRK